MTLEIIGFPISNTVRAARMTAHEKGVDYTLTPSMPHAEDVRPLSPLGKVPAMRHDDFILFESGAICRYIDLAFEGPALMPRDLQSNARIESWIAAITTGYDKEIMRNYVVEYIFNKDEDGNVIRHAIDRAVQKFPMMFAALGEAVKDGFVGGSEFTLADCHLAPILAMVPGFPESAAELENHGALKDYMARISERESFKASEPPRPGG